MISFIISESDIFFIEKYRIIIDKIMINYDIDYQVIIYENELSEKINDTFKIYIIADIENNARYLINKIRKEKDDWQSMIILTSETDVNKSSFLNSNLLLLDYINKNRNLDIKLKENIIISIKNYNQRPNTLKFTYKNCEYNIEYQSILYIEKEQNSKKCIIQTKENKYYITGYLKDIEKKLDDRFIKCSKSNIINIEQVRLYDRKNNIIEFNNKMIFLSVSRNWKKKIVEKMRNMSK